MLRIQKLSRPTKRSGFKLESGKKTEMRGIIVINQNKFPVYVDKFTRPEIRKRGKRK